LDEGPSHILNPSGAVHAEGEYHISGFFQTTESEKLGWNFFAASGKFVARCLAGLTTIEPDSPSTLRPAEWTTSTAPPKASMHVMLA
jgi:hypothetical protein